MSPVINIPLKSMKEKDYIENWIKNVSEIKPELGGFAVCPFAKQAKYKIERRNISDIIPEDGYHVIIFIVDESLKLEQLRNWVDVYNQEYPEWKFFEDSKERDTFINGVQTSNGKYNLILCQPREKLRKYREMLSKTEYYKNWSDDYLNEILQEDINILGK